MLALNDWEDRFRVEIEKIDKSKRQAAGALLPVIPNHEDWNEFLGLMKTFWRRAVDDFPCCLLILYGGLAFYKYDDNRIWPQFAEAVESDDYQLMNKVKSTKLLQKRLEIIRLKIRQRRSSTDYVGSAVHHIGIPLSLWDDFLKSASGRYGAR